ncbi:MAG: hypothetical protein U0575_00945 [Phycisphaerales bacterium]
MPVLSTAAPVSGDVPDGLPPCGYDVEYYVPPDCGIFNVRGSVTAVNAPGTAVGWIDGCPNLYKRRAFIWWPDGAIQLIANPYVYSMEAMGINNSNQVLIRMTSLVPGDGYVPAIWDDGTLTIFGYPDWANTSDTGGINDLGMVTGQYGDVVNGPYPLAAIWSDGGLTDISGAFPQPDQQPRGINNLGQVAGTMAGGPTPPSGNAFRAFLYDGGRVTDLGVAPGCVNSVARGLSQAGHVACYGWSSIWEENVSDTHPWHGFLWRQGEWTALPPLPGHNEAVAEAVNAQSVAVGYSYTLGQPSTNQVVIWINAVPYSIKQYTNLNGTHGLGIALAISDSGHVVGEGLAEAKVRPARLMPRQRPTADITFDCVVDGADIAALLQSWGSSVAGGSADADINGDGAVDGTDLGIMLSQWTIAAANTP